MSKWSENVVTMYFKNLFSCLNNNGTEDIKNINVYNQGFTFHKPAYFSNLSKYDINEKFLDHDGYFVKLIVKNNIVGYIFRCTLKNAEFELKDKSIVTVPFFVTCFYQPMIKNMNLKTLKLLGKERSLKTGLRTIKNFASTCNTKEEFETYLKNLNINAAFPEYDNMMKQSDTFNKPELLIYSEKEYTNLKHYLETFNDKIEKYYSGINSENILKIWIS